MAIDNKHILEIAGLRSTLDQGSDGAGATEMKVNQSAVAKESSVVGSPYRWSFRDDKNGATGDYHECVNQDISSGVILKGHVGYYNDKGELSGDGGFTWDPDNTEITLKDPNNGYELDFSIDSSGSALICGPSDIRIQNQNGDIYLDTQGGSRGVIVGSDSSNGIYTGFSDYRHAVSVSTPSTEHARLYWDNGSGRFKTIDDAGTVEDIAYTSDLTSFINGAGLSDRIAYWTDTDTLSYLPVQYYDDTDPTRPNTLQFYVDNDDATEWPLLELLTISASPAADDVIGEYKFTGYDSGSNIEEYASIRGVINDPSVGAEYGKMELRIVHNGSIANVATITSNIDGTWTKGLVVQEKMAIGTDSIGSSSAMEIFGDGTLEIWVDDTMEIHTDVDLSSNPVNNVGYLELVSNASSPGPPPFWESDARLWWKNTTNNLYCEDNTTAYPVALGPTSSTDNAITRYNGTSGGSVEDSIALLDDTGNLTVARGDATNVKISYGNTNGTAKFGVSTESNPEDCLFGHDGTDTIILSQNSIKISCWGATSSITLDPAGDDVIIASGDIQLSNEYTAGAPTPTGYLVLKDSNGTPYKIPAEAV